MHITAEGIAVPLSESGAPKSEAEGANPWRGNTTLLVGASVAAGLFGLGFVLVRRGRASDHSIAPPPREGDFHQ